MKLRDLAVPALRDRLAGPGLALACGPFTILLRSPLAAVAQAVGVLYADHELLGEDRFRDFEVVVRAAGGWRRWLRPQVVFECDGQRPFKPLPLDQAVAMLEWGLNWVITSHAHDRLLIHAAVVEREGRCLVLAAEPGSGKSTLCAALALRGWRLLSDELCLVSLEDGSVQPVARPVSLKNRSIEVIQAFDRRAVIGPLSRDTVKGTVAHLQPPAASVATRERSARPGLILFPKYQDGAPLRLEPVGRARALMELVGHSFNYSVLGAQGFEALARLVETAPAHRLQYSQFETLWPALDALWEASA